MAITAAQKIGYRNGRSKYSIANDKRIISAVKNNERILLKLSLESTGIIKCQNALNALKAIEAVSL